MALKSICCHVIIHSCHLPMLEQLQNQRHKSFEWMNESNEKSSYTHNCAYFIYFTLSQGELWVTAMDSMSYAFHLAGLMCPDITQALQTPKKKKKDEKKILNLFKWTINLLEWFVCCVCVECF